MNFTHYNFSSSEIGISEKEIFQLLKIEGNPEGDHIAGIVRRIQRELLEKNVPAKGGYALFNKQILDIKRGIICLNDVEIHAGSQICGYLKESEKFALFICTAGSYITEITHSYTRSGDLLEAYIVDMMGSMIVERAMNLIQEKMEAHFLIESLRISQRYSPGYCNWALVSQKEIFALLPENNCGISLTESSLMLPIKSVSGIIGVGSHVSKKDYGCEICNNQACIYREVRMKNNISPLI